MKPNKILHPAIAAIQSIITAFPDFDFETLVEKKPERRLLSTEETMAYLGGISRMSIWRLVNQEKTLKPVMVGARQMFDIEDLDLFIKRSKKLQARKLCKGGVR